MQYQEACKDSANKALVNMNIIDSLIEEVEDFDGLVESPLWGSIQEKLIALKEDYQLVPAIFEDAILEADSATETDEGFEEILNQVTSQLRGELSSILLNTNNRSLSINVQVVPTTLH